MLEVELKPAPSPIPHNLAEQSALDLVNSTWMDYRAGNHRYDRLPLRRFQDWFLERHGLELERPLRPSEVAKLAELRTLIRRLLGEWGAGKPLAPADRRRLDAYLSAAPLRRRLQPGGLEAELGPLRRRDLDWLNGELVTSMLDLMASGEPRRLKVCTNDNCSWMFYDASANRSRRWCDGDICGNLIKVRRFRSRKA